MIHWPNPKANRDNWAEANAETWRAMEEAYEAGKVRAIGISNFQVHHFEELLKTAKVTPMVNQLFVNPSDMEDEIVAFNNEHNVLTEAYSPLGTGKMLTVAAIQEIADKYNKSVAQIALRWSLQHGFLPLPKSTHKERIIENGQLFDFELTADDMAALDKLEGVAGSHNDADKTNF